MADRESISEWLAGAKFRLVSPVAGSIVERLVIEGRAEWIGWRRQPATKYRKARTLRAARLTDKGRAMLTAERS